MTTAFLKKRATKFSAYSTVYILVVLGILSTANFLANRYNKSFDSTTNKRFSLSDQTLKVVSGLKEDVTISYFDEAVAFPRAKDLLDRYSTLSPKLKVEFLDPFKKPTLAKQYGITQTGAIVLQTASGKRQDARSLSEEEITSAIVRLFKKSENTACFTTGAGEHSLEDTTSGSYSAVKSLIEKNNYKTQTVNLIERPEVPAGCKLIVVAGPRVDYPQPVVDGLKKYVEAGGRAVFLSDPPLKTGKESIAENAGLKAVLESWGVTLNNDLILDPAGGLYGMGPEIAVGSLYETHPIVRAMKRIATAFPLVRSLQPRPTDKTSVEKLVSTSKNSLAVTDFKAMAGGVMPKGDPQSYPVVAAGTYRGKVEGRFVVVGSSDWIANYALGFGGNKDLFLNMVNWLTNDEELISIRPKDPEDRRIQLTAAQMALVRIVSQFLIPLGVIALGLMVWWRRR